MALIDFVNKPSFLIRIVSQSTIQSMKKKLPFDGPITIKYQLLLRKYFEKVPCSIEHRDYRHPNNQMPFPDIFSFSSCTYGV